MRPAGEFYDRDCVYHKLKEERYQSTLRINPVDFDRNKIAKRYLEQLNKGE